MSRFQNVMLNRIHKKNTAELIKNNLASPFFIFFLEKTPRRGEGMRVTKKCAKQLNFPGLSNKLYFKILRSARRTLH